MSSKKWDEEARQARERRKRRSAPDHVVPGPSPAAPPPDNPGDAYEGQLPGAEKIAEPDDHVWVPFPVDAIPEGLGKYVIEGSQSILCDPVCMALPLITAAGAAIGNSRVIRIKSDWDEPPLLWTAIVCPSGQQKTPAIKHALRFTRERQEMAFKNYRRAVEEHNEAKANLGEEDAGAPPDPPERYLVNDITFESLVNRLSTSPRGLLCSNDELAGWVKSFGAYKSGRGGDLEGFLSVYSASSITIDRKHEGGETTYVPRAFVAVTGGIQPKILLRVMTEELFDSGLTARLLCAQPPRRTRQWCDMEIDPETTLRAKRIFDSLWMLQPDAGKFGDRPYPITMAPEAKKLFIDFFNSHGKEAAVKDDNMASAWSKLEAVVPRLALIFFLCARADDGTLEDATVKPEDLKIGPDELDRAITLVRWFKRETERIYAIQRPKEAETNEFLRWIQAQDDPVTVRDFFVRFQRRFSRSVSAREYLESLVKSKKLMAEEFKQDNGHTAFRFRIFYPS